MGKEAGPSRRQLMALAGAVAISRTAAAAPPSTPTHRALFDSLMVRGPFQVKTANPLSFAISEAKRDLLVRVTYPVGTAESAAAYPVVVFSHAELSSKDLYCAIADHWASHGVATVLPTHIDSASLGYVRGRMNDSDVLAGRVTDLSFLIDHIGEVADATPGLRGLIDENRIAVGGHGLGALAALATAGLSYLRADGAMTASANPRVKALVSYNGAGPMAVAPAGWSDVAIPVFAAAGTADPGLIVDGALQPWRWRMSSYTLTSGKPRYGLSVTLADHSFGGLIGDAAPSDHPDATGLAIVNVGSTAFLAALLVRDPAAANFLDAANFAELTDNRAFLERDAA